MRTLSFFPLSLAAKKAEDVTSMKKIFKSSLKIFTLTFLVVFALNLNKINNTNSTLADKEKSKDNSFAAGEWGNTESSSGSGNTLSTNEETLSGDTPPQSPAAPNINDGTTNPEALAPLLDETTSPENTPTDVPSTAPPDPTSNDTSLGG
jgi:hypothetical protein